ncbi:hypothetical protein HMSP1_41 [Sinorhizobium phage HMSP1-Susan]|nr:hypothetical protein HMSP1_41 [Sinorhizobium phage HMSP1-Susan]
MATVTADVVGVRLEADTDKYINNIRRAESDFVAALNRMGNRAQQAGDASAVVFDRATGSFTKAGNAADKAAEQVTRLGTVTNRTGQYTGNIAAQFNDIGVQLAGGTSPFLIAIQQGTQLNQVFSDIRANGGGVRSALTGALSAIIHPANLATLAVIALGGAAVQYFADIISGGEDANQTLEKQHDIIRAVADRWGDAVPALKEYADELDRVKERAEEAQAVEIFREDAFAAAREGLADIQVGFAELLQNLIDADNTQTEVIGNLQQAFKDYQDAINEGSDSTDEYNRVVQAMAAAAKSIGIPAIADFESQLDSFNAGVEVAIEKVNRLTNAMVSAGTQLGTLGPLFSEDGKIRTPEEFTPGGNIPTPDRRPLIELDGLPGEFDKSGKRRGGGRARKEREDAYEGFTRRIREQTDAIEAEAEAQAKLNPLINDYGYAAEAAKLYQEGLNAAKKAGIELGPQEVAALAALTDGLATARAEQERMLEQQDKTVELFESWNDTAKSAVGGLIDDLTSGTSAAESFRNALSKIADQLIEIGLSSIFDTGNAGGLIGMLFGGGGTKLPGRANGGPVVAGKAYMVGENGPEPFIPGVAGSILPNTPNIGSPNSVNSSIMGADVRVFFDDNGNLQATIDRRAQAVADAAVARSQSGEIARLPGNLKTAQQRGMIK